MEYKNEDENDKENREASKKKKLEEQDNGNKTLPIKRELFFHFKKNFITLNPCF